jgi:hypothetical protein
MQYLKYLTDSISYAIHNTNEQESALRIVIVTYALDFIIILGVLGIIIFNQQNYGIIFFGLFVIGLFSIRIIRNLILIGKNKQI